MSDPAQMESEHQARGPGSGPWAHSPGTTGPAAEVQPGVGPLDAQQLLRVRQWVARHGPSGQSLAALQSALHVPARGGYDDATAQAVATYQQQQGLTVDGCAGHATLQRLGITEPDSPAQSAGDSTPAVVGEPPAGQPAADGVTVSLYNKFVRGGADLEFERRAEQHAKQYHSAGLSGDALTWDRATPFTSQQGLVADITAIHAALGHWCEEHPLARPQPPGRRKARGTAEDGHDPGNERRTKKPAPAHAEHDSGRPSEREGGAGGPPDRRSQIKNLAIFTHGSPRGIAVDARQHTFRGDRGIHTDHGHSDPANVNEFVSLIASSLTSDVNVLLYACSTGLDDSKPEGDHATRMPEEGERGGDQSFAAQLDESLDRAGLSEASVYGHLNADHTTENPLARVFGADGGGGVGGMHLFDILYPPAYVDGLLAKLVPELPDAPSEEQQGLRKQLRAWMWEHYRDCISGELHRKNAKQPSRFGRDTYLGMEAFQDPGGTAAKLHEDFERCYLTPTRLRQLTLREPAPDPPKATRRR